MLPQVDKKEFRKATQELGVQATPEQLDAIFDKWDTDGSGGIDFKELDFALKGAKTRPQDMKRASTSSKEIQRALREKLQGGKKAAPGKAAIAAKKATEKPKKLKTSSPREEDTVAEEEEEEAEGVWTCKKWVSALAIPAIIAKALKLPKRVHCSAFEYVRRLEREQVEELMRESDLGGLIDIIAEGEREHSLEKGSP